MQNSNGSFSLYNRCYGCKCTQNFRSDKQFAIFLQKEKKWIRNEKKNTFMRIFRKIVIFVLELTYWRKQLSAKTD